MQRSKEDIELLEKHFHEVIDAVTLGCWPEKQFPFPKLTAEMIGIQKPMFHPIYGMFGGISYKVFEENGELKLTANASSRMDENFEANYEATTKHWTRIR